MHEQALEHSILTAVVFQFSASKAGNLGKFYFLLIFKGTQSNVLVPTNALGQPRKKAVTLPMAHSLGD